MATVRANQTCIITHEGFSETVREGQAFDDEDGIVRDFPWLFEAPVEQATAAPGQRRNVTRRK